MSTRGCPSLRLVVLFAASGACSYAPYTSGSPSDLGVPVSDLALPRADASAAADLQAAAPQGALRYALDYDGDQHTAVTVAADAAGGFAVGGRFHQQIRLGSATFTAPGTQSDALITKHAPDGTLQWARVGTGAAQDAVTGLAIDKSGNVIAAGVSQGSIDFGRGPLTGATPSSRSTFVAKYTPDGALLWARQFPNTGLGSNLARDVTVDAEDNVVVTGTFEATVDFGGGPLESAVSLATYVLKLSPAGQHLLSRQVGPPTGIRGTVRAVRVAPDGDLIFAGSAVGTVDFGGGPIAVDANEDHAFFARYSPAVTYKLARLFGTQSDSSRGSGLAVDRSGDILILGDFIGSIDCGGGPLVGSSRSATFVARYSKAGEHRWSHMLASPSGLVLASGLALDSASNVVIGGKFTETVDFGVPLPSARTEADPFLLKLDRSGSPLWARSYASEGGEARVLSVAVAPDDSPIGAGVVDHQLDVGGTILTGGSEGQSEGAFVIKLSP